MVRRLEANRRADLLGALERRQVQRAHDDALVGDTQPNAPAQLVGREQVAQGGGQRVDVNDLAVTHDAGRQLRAGGALDLDLAGARLDGGDVAWLDVEADDGFRFGVSHWAQAK